MDPDVTLRVLREHVRAWEEGDRTVSDSDRFAEMVESFAALDGWLTGLGHLPWAWQRHRPPAA